MTTDWLSGGFIIALAAVLWLAYLLPSWFRSRQYLATERNAVRLQQTLRILAETAEVPQEVRIEANARSIAEQERILKHRSAQRELHAVPVAVRTADRLRRSRAVTSLVLAVSLSVAVLGGMQAVYTGAWIILIGGVIATVASVAVLVRLAKAGRRLRLPIAYADLALESPDLVDFGDSFEQGSTDAASSFEETATDADERTAGDIASGWVPVAVPRPLYLARAAAAPLGLGDADDAADDEYLDTSRTAELAEATARASRERADPGHHESLRRAAAQSEAALRARLDAAGETVTELPVAPAAPVVAAVPSRFSRMGIVEGDTESHLDLDAVLARRRAG
ncbi:hypothetical protein [Herbiconiux liangxiaofengii]|uniref:hypothetical protein n=1 Tax=Herbiconiux liangxiaofengii TaxID=3342795 RepID=UPI0035B7E46C